MKTGAAGGTLFSLSELPTPEKARRVREETVARLLKRHRIRRFSAAASTLVAISSLVAAFDWLLAATAATTIGCRPGRNDPASTATASARR